MLNGRIVTHAFGLAEHSSFRSEAQAQPERACIQPSISHCGPQKPRVQPERYFVAQFLALRKTP